MEIDNLVLEQLRNIRNDIATFKSATQESFNFVNTQMSVLEQQLGSVITMLPAYGEKIAALERRIARIERRLDLVEGP